MNTKKDNNTILALHSVTQEFGGLKAVNNVDLHVEKGIILGVIGPNGAGKTTLFNLITGVYPPVEGEIFLKGENISKLPSYTIIAKGISRTFQNIRLFGRMSVLDNVKSSFYANKTYSIFDAVFRSSKFRNGEQQITTKAMELLESVNLADKAYQIANTLPYGEQRRLEIARALGSNPTILLLDEPAAGMNHREIETLNKTIYWLREHFQLTIILIEHHMKLVMGICEQVMVMNFGKRLAFGTTDEIRQDSKVLEAYLGKDYEI